MNTVVAERTDSALVRGHFDPYQLDPAHIMEPPQTLGAILRKIGPGMVLAASIVGSGELIATTTLGAKVGYAMMWLIVLSCLIKAVVQSFLGRYTIAKAETSLQAFDRIPGPRYKVNWVIWAWLAMVFMTLFQICAMFIGVSQVMHLVIPQVSVGAWVIGFYVLTLVLLLGGAYKRIESIAMVKVGLFTLITLLAAVVLTDMPQYFSWGQVIEGFKFQIPEAGFAIAIATFGITGVGATELYMYTYWCVEKGYAQYTGKNDGSAAWRRRANGWIHVMNVDVVCSMIIYTVATVAFYLLGAGILHAMGEVPSGTNMITALSNIYTQTLGEWAKWLFYLGAIVILYGTIFAATAGHSRMVSDMMRLLGVYQHDDYKARLRWRDISIVVLVTVPLIMYWSFGQAPVAMVTWGGLSQAVTLPIISLGTLYLIYKYLPKEVKAPAWMDALLWVAAIVICALMSYYFWFELKKFLAS
jgi:manganese transport protein